MELREQRRLLLLCSLSTPVVFAACADHGRAAARIDAGATAGSHAGSSTGVAAAGGIGATNPDASSTPPRFDAGPKPALPDGGLQNPTLPDGGTMICSDASNAPAKVMRRCAPATLDECSGSDVNPALPNGDSGNGFDDDCDGKVDEGCGCGAAHPTGTTRSCWLVPSSQVDAVTQLPVGFCKSNARGTSTCVGGSGEFDRPHWGACRGAQLPYQHDVCAHGDFDCDGREADSDIEDCSCKRLNDGCPTEPLVTTPFPDPHALLQIDATPWTDGDRDTKNWQWTITGGDCDDILPHPTFAVYAGPDSSTAARLSSDQPQQGLGSASNQNGFVIGPADGVGASISPSFALSGDYLVKGTWQGSDGARHECTVKVAVRAPGVRVELCWQLMPNDLDLHVARLSGASSCMNGHGWFDSCQLGLEGDDCNYLNCASSAGDPSPWGYAKSPDSACHGWGSRRGANLITAMNPKGADCDNPRLDLDNVDCDPSVPVPGAAIGLQTGFCSPENINIDAPHAGDRFAIGVNFIGRRSGGGAPVKPHVNVYCNGERKLAFGYDPSATPVADYPHMIGAGVPSGANDTEFWSVATLTAITDASGKLTDCSIIPVTSQAPDPARDGSSAFCVEKQVGKFVPATGAYPTASDPLCLH